MQLFYIILVAVSIALLFDFYYRVYKNYIQQYKHIQFHRF